MTARIERFETNPRMSRVVCHNSLVYLCGQTAASGVGDVTQQTEEALARVDALLARAGTDKTRILSALIHLRSMSDFTSMNTVWEAWMPTGSAPARTTVEATLAAPELLIEITIVAAADGAAASPAGG
ncbi:RidA family protein [Bradyrhizobium sp. CIR3A]|uniref:RidA family protein n=1 Tax=Bradyrhizobium sp. CIR3A TaxID=2663838 RepID=UPI0016055F5E|nr:RidA family protein [Bradyrhizobium sp. CIR3A]MBB4264347.1 enamine deaminase RidA (YjgF/YER057c/UK114 family) [Bradyrhizobium sp. CIR3A]